ncbi:MAG: putative nucleic acid-binding Zn-ribbon protein [Natronomonas sp.]|jgi:predicted  nucleic acid-binding Zn-ribbon protein|uniref:OapC/ArvC family zinc-ribbon domain-containing protein n=1 Tax=Natronomonas sp. TaxID=2184060 RepID=UPI00398943DD
MPHQCTGCGHTFEDGSKEMLSGCPECGGNKFQFRPAGSGPTETATDDATSDGEPSTATEPPDPPETGSSVAETVGRATTKVRDFVSSEPAPTDDDPPDPNASWPDESDDVGAEGAAASADPNVSTEPADASEPYPATDSRQDNLDDSSGDGILDGDGEIIDADAHRQKREESEDVAQASARSDVVSTDELDVSTNPEANPGSNDSAESGLDEPALDKPAAEASTDSAGAPTDSAGAPTDSAGASTEPANPLAASGAPDDTSSPESEGRVVSEPSDEEPDIAELREQLNDQFESIKIVEPGQYELNLMELYDREEYIIALQENGRYVIQVPEQWIGEEPGER